MSLRDDLPLKYLHSIPGGKPADAELPLVIVVHGRGADANDLADIAPMLDSGGYRFLFPQAPKPFEAYPGVAFGWTWFDGWPAERSSIVRSRELLLEFIDGAVHQYPTPEGQVILSGFSQGGLMSLDVGFRTPQQLAGIVVMSGAVYEEDLPDLASRKEQRVLIVHGTGDDMIPLVAARRARQVLETHGVSPEYHEFPMGHHVTPESLAVVRAFIGQSFASR